MKEQPETFWAYLAGFVDGDGCIGLYENGGGTRRKYTYGKVVVMQKDPAILHWIVDQVGEGSVCKRGKSGFSSDMHYISWGSRASREICEKLLPYLVIKKDKAMKVLEYKKKPRGDSFRNRPELPEVVRLYQTGISAKEVAETMKLNPLTVNDWLRKMGLTRSLSESQKLRRARESQLLGV